MVEEFNSTKNLLIRLNKPHFFSGDLLSGTVCLNISSLPAERLTIFSKDLMKSLSGNDTLMAIED